MATLPINDPKYLVLVVVDEPSKAYAYGSTVAVPVAKEIIESLIVLEKIPPNSKENKIIVKKPWKRLIIEWNINYLMNSHKYTAKLLV